MRDWSLVIGKGSSARRFNLATAGIGAETAAAAACRKFRYRVTRRSSAKAAKAAARSSEVGPAGRLEFRGEGEVLENNFRGFGREKRSAFDEM